MASDGVYSPNAIIAEEINKKQEGSQAPEVGSVSREASQNCLDASGASLAGNGFCWEGYDRAGKACALGDEGGLASFSHFLLPAGHLGGSYGENPPREGKVREDLTSLDYSGQRSTQEEKGRGKQEEQARGKEQGASQASKQGEASKEVLASKEEQASKEEEQARGKEQASKWGWSRKQKRAYHRIKSGLARHKGERLRFLTLTTPPSPKRGLMEAFKALHERIKRANKAFDYIAIKTREGQAGVLHVLFFGDYIPQRWLSEAWEELIGAKVVDIRACKEKVRAVKRLASYCVSQYCAGQSEFETYSWSWGWVWRGFVKAWEEFKAWWRDEFFSGVPAGMIKTFPYWDKRAYILWDHLCYMSKVNSKSS